MVLYLILFDADDALLEGAVLALIFSFMMIISNQIQIIKFSSNSTKKAPLQKIGVNKVI